MTNSNEAAHLGFTTFLLATDPDENGVSYPFLWHQTARASVFNEVADDNIEARNAAAAKAAEDAVSLALAFGNAFMAVGGKTVTDRGDGLLEFIEVTEEDADGNVVVRPVVKVSKFPDWVAAPTTSPAAPASKPAAPAGKLSAPSVPNAPANRAPAPVQRPQAPAQQPVVDTSPIRMTFDTIEVQAVGQGTVVKVKGKSIPDGYEFKYGPKLPWNVINQYWDDTTIFATPGIWPMNTPGLIAVCSRNPTNPQYPKEVVDIEMEAF